MQGELLAKDGEVPFPLVWQAVWIRPFSSTKAQTYPAVCPFIWMVWMYVMFDCFNFDKMWSCSAEKKRSMSLSLYIYVCIYIIYTNIFINNKSNNNNDNNNNGNNNNTIIYRKE